MTDTTTTTTDSTHDQTDLEIEIAAAAKWLATLRAKRLRMYQLAFISGQGMNEADALVAAREVIAHADADDDAKDGAAADDDDWRDEAIPRMYELARAYSRVTGLDLDTLASYIDRGEFALDLDAHADQAIRDRDGALKSTQYVVESLTDELDYVRETLDRANAKLEAIKAITIIATA